MIEIEHDYTTQPIIAVTRKLHAIHQAPPLPSLLAQLVQIDQREQASAERTIEEMFLMWGNPTHGRWL